MGWRLEHPWLAAAAGVVFLIVLILRWRLDERVALEGGSRVAMVDLPALLTMVGIILSIIALGNPQYGIENTEETKHGVAILSVVDTSESMQALDFGLKKNALTRMAGAKKVISDFIKARNNDLHGLLVFGEVVYTLVPLTSDQNLIQDTISQIQTRMAGRATAIGDALALGVKRLRDAPVESKIMILISDGENTAGELKPLEAARFAEDQGVKVYTIGIGSGGIAPIEVDTLFGKRVQNVKLPMDEKTLKAIAEITGGLYFNAKNIEEMQTVFARIDELEKTKFEAHVSVTFSDHYRLFLDWALILIITSLGWQTIVRKRFPWV